MSRHVLQTTTCHLPWACFRDASSPVDGGHLLTWNGSLDFNDAGLVVPVQWCHVLHAAGILHRDVLFGVVGGVLLWQRHEATTSTGTHQLVGRAETTASGGNAGGISPRYSSATNSVTAPPAASSSGGRKAGGQCVASLTTPNACCGTVGTTTAVLCEL